MGLGFFRVIDRNNSGNPKWLTLTANRSVGGSTERAATSRGNGCFIRIRAPHGCRDRGSRGVSHTARIERLLDHGISVCRLANVRSPITDSGQWPSVSSPTWPPVGRIRCPPTEEVLALIERSSRLLEPCFEAWCKSTEYNELWLVHKKGLLKEHDAMRPGYAKESAELRARLLRHGGSEVVPPLCPDTLIQLLKDQGAVDSESTVCVLDRGERPDSHANTVALWRSGGAVAIGVGYAQSDDLIWRQHSWAWDRDGSLIETTQTQARDFGVRLVGPPGGVVRRRVKPSRRTVELFPHSSQSQQELGVIGGHLRSETLTLRPAKMHW